MSIQDELIVVDNDLDHLDNTTYKIASFDLDHTLIKPKGLLVRRSTYNLRMYRMLMNLN